MTQLSQINQIVLPQSKWDEILSHCRRKLAGEFLAGESKIRRAYGILAGTQVNGGINISRVLPVKKNARSVEPLKSYMATVMKKYAKPSKTPIEQRGWITDPLELKECYEACDKEDLQVFGTYHMHLIPWEDDPLRDTPTVLDTVLAENSNLFTFIIAMVDESKPSIRVFFEGKLAEEVPLIIDH
jgi:hypothetical protein